MHYIMINSETVTLLANIVLALLGLAGIWALTKLSSHLKIKAEAEQATELDKLIYQFVAAAEQTLKEVDPNGTLRKKYVVDLLEELGIKVSQEINARIEAAVYGLNLEQDEIAG